jgi:hypothetical protein
LERFNLGHRKFFPLIATHMTKRIRANAAPEAK